MKFYYPFARGSISPLLLITSVFLIFSCTKPPTPSSIAVSQSPSSVSSNVRSQSISLNRGDIPNIEKLMLQLNRANHRNKELALGLLEDAKKNTKRDIKEGLHGERSGLSKLFCGSVVNYPTVEALIGCAESLALEDASLDVKVRRFKEASKIYRAATEFSDRTKNSISVTERKKIEDNIKCLDAFVKSPNPNSPGCELIRTSLKKP